MRKIIIVILVILLAAGGFALYRHIQYQTSPDRVANEFVAKITAGDIDGVYGQLADHLKAEDKQYWQDSEFFRILAGHKGETKMVSREAATSTDPSQPNPYLPETEAWRYKYQFFVGELPYELTFDMTRNQGEDAWQISEIEGAYAAP